MWLIIIGVLIVIGIFSVASEKNEANEVEMKKYAFKEIKEHVNKRVSAYADYLRRTSSDRVGAMTDNELHDLIERAMAGYEKDVAKSKWLSNISFALGGLCFIAFISGDKSAEAFGPIFIAGGFVFRSWKKARVDKKYIANGWEPERLKID
ncbi:hypothetical protein Q4493_15465 [Colwellia sp. 1_MG-2023]|uniref:hypothetical protein n=1 Tax=Colwellia sp. 1_MG-2023 TaxID=3062649 RepID=UPI0026E2E959|nr:hypothetical protein [Colwellia sp. 1_MG-2023]MDO6447169.1 hypothetical protein [Colwellia sp. 1_MG-2023]